MAWRRQTTSHYLSQCWPRSVSPYSFVRPQWAAHKTQIFCSGLNVLNTIYGHWVWHGRKWVIPCVCTIYLSVPRRFTLVLYNFDLYKNVSPIPSDRVLYLIPKSDVILDRDRRRHDPDSSTVEEVKKLSQYHTTSENASLSLKVSGHQLRTWNTQSSLAWALIRTFGGYYAYMEIFQVMYIVLTFLRPPLQQ